MISALLICPFFPNPGNSPGWSDVYEAGIPCQWIDVTDYPTTTGPVVSTLSANMNPDAMLCEGTPIIDNNGTQLWNLTSLVAMDGTPVFRPACSFGSNPSTLANNYDSVPAILPQQGNGYVTGECADKSQSHGSKRNCGYSLDSSNALLSCSPNGTVVASCALAPATTSSSVVPSQAIRFCESSISLGTGTACDYNRALLQVSVPAAVPTYLPAQTFKFACPDARDSVEVGGAFSMYSGPLFLDDASVPVRCSYTIFDANGVQVSSASSSSTPTVDTQAFQIGMGVGLGVGGFLVLVGVAIFVLHRSSADSAPPAQVRPLGKGTGQGDLEMVPAASQKSALPVERAPQAHAVTFHIQE